VITDAPTAAPTATPTDTPTDMPTNMPTFHPCDDGTHGCDLTSTECASTNGNDNTFTCECLEGFVSTYDITSCSATAAPTSAPTSHPTPSLCDFDQEYRVNARDSNNDEIWHDFDCVTKTDCDAATQYETVAATETSDRECFALVVCTADEYQTVAPTYNSDRTCGALTTCDASLQYQSVGPTAVSDRQCMPLTICINLGEVQYTSVQGTTTSDRVCTDIADCGITQIQVVGPSSTWQRGCTAVIPCDFLTQYESVPKTATTQPVCINHADCTNVQYESAGPTRSTQRQCTDYTVCDINTEYSTGLQASGEIACASLTSCTPTTQYETEAPQTAQFNGAPTLTINVSDRICTNEVVCGSSFDKTGTGAAARCTARAFVRRRLSGGQNAIQYWYKCPSATMYQVSGDPYDAANAPVCAALTVCSSSWQYETTAVLSGSGANSDSYVADRSCALVAICGATTEHETQAPTTSSNRVCVTNQICSTAQYETSKPTPSADRNCATATICTVGETYISTGLMLTSDRACTALQVCKVSPLQYEHTAYTTSTQPDGSVQSNTDRLCVMATNCAKTKGLFVSNPVEFLATTPPTMDVVCASKEACVPTQYESFPGTAGTGIISNFYTTTNACTALTPACNFVNQFEDVPPSASSDRHCESLTVCGTDPHYWESKPPSQVADRECTLTTPAPTSTPTPAPTSTYAPSPQPEPEPEPTARALTASDVSLAFDAAGLSNCAASTAQLQAMLLYLQDAAAGN
jgi:hypothetical protein